MLHIPCQSSHHLAVPCHRHHHSHILLLIWYCARPPRFPLACFPHIDARACSLCTSPRAAPSASTSSLSPANHDNFANHPPCLTPTCVRPNPTPRLCCVHAPQPPSSSPITAANELCLHRHQPINPVRRSPFPCVRVCLCARTNVCVANVYIFVCVCVCVCLCARM